MQHHPTHILPQNSVPPSPEEELSLLSDEYELRPKEECGVFGIFAPGQEVARISFFGLFALQHRGQESAGMAVSDGQELRIHKDLGLVTQIFSEKKIRKMAGISAIGHTRYSTTGGNNACNAQPLFVRTSDGMPIALAHNGNLVNTSALREKLQRQVCQFATTNDSEVIAHLLARAYKGNMEEAIRKTMQQIKGAYSLVILTPETLIGVRDPHGIRPLCIGLLDGKRYVLASESCALTTIGAEYIRDVEPGEAILIDRNGLRAFQALPPNRLATCLLEFIYFSRPDTMLHNRTLHHVRQNMGRELAKEYPVDADIVIPIPDTGTPGALGYAEESGIRYTEGVIKSRYIQRTFIQPSQQMREMGARMKYTPLRPTLEGKRVVMVDDSIVRGTTTGKLVKLLFEAGAKEVHVRITAPPVKYPCYYGIDMADQKELIAATHSIEQIRKKIGATSLGYLSLAGAVRAIETNENTLCRACFDKKYPIRIPQDVKISKMMLEETTRQREAQKALEAVESAEDIKLEYFEDSVQEPALV